ncbi:MAG: MBL fold metallo-hydrolase [Candidatus Woesearchaeota archaeon]
MQPSFFIIIRQPVKQRRLRPKLINFEWLGHDTFRITAGGKVIYTDPFVLDENPAAASIILISHEHYDHCDRRKIDLITDKETKIIAPAACASKIDRPFAMICAGKKLIAEKIEIEVVEAYNIGKKRSDGHPFHPKGDGVGYIFTLKGKRIYFAGDTDLIPEMKEIKADIAMLPISGKFAMTTEEAAEAVKVIKPKYVIPMHYNCLEGLDINPEEFKKIVKGAEVVIPPTN